MKITIEENKQKRTYPYLGKDGSGLIACFTSPERGVVIKGDDFHKTGRRFDSFNEDAFTTMHPQPEPEPVYIPVEERKYPYVGVAKDPDIKVLFTASYKGICIEDLDNEDSNLGVVHCGYIESDFTPIPVSRIIIDLE